MYISQVLIFKLPSQIHPDLSMKLPCFCAILVGSLTRGSRFFNNGIWSVSFTLSVPIFGWFGGFSEFAGVFSGCGKMCCLLGIYGKKKTWGLQFQKKDTSKEGTKKMVVPKLLFCWSKMSFQQASQLGVLCVLKTHKNMVLWRSSAALEKTPWSQPSWTDKLLFRNFDGQVS